MYLIRVRLTRLLVDKFKININYDLLRRMHSQANFTYATSRDPFSLQRSKSRYYDIYLSNILKKLSLFYVSFKIIKIIEYVYYLMSFFKGCFFDKNNKYWQYDLSKIDTDSFYRILTITKNIDRAISPLLKTNKSFLDLPVIFYGANCQKIPKLLLIKTAIKFKFYSFWHVKQYLILKKTMPKIKFRYLILEEGGDFISNLIYSLYSPRAHKSILTHKSPYFNGFVKNNFDINIVYNKISYQDSISVKNKTILRKRDRIKSLRRSSKPRILYFTTAESEKLPKKLKLNLDTKIINLLEKSKLDFSISFHPQDLKRGYKKIIIKQTQLKSSRIRKEIDLCNFIGKNDVVITHPSTVATYANDIAAKLIILNNDVSSSFKILLSKLYHSAIFIKYDDINNNIDILAKKIYEKK
jgi:hypothetical protein